MYIHLFHIDAAFVTLAMKIHFTNVIYCISLTTFKHAPISHVLNYSLCLQAKKTLNVWPNCAHQVWETMTTDKHGMQHTRYNDLIWYNWKTTTARIRRC